MALNLQYEAIGKGFVQQYYALFDDPNQRRNLANMYNVSVCPLTRAGLAPFGSIAGGALLHDVRGRPDTGRAQNHGENRCKCALVGLSRAG